jgi:hypothetical protein
MSAILKSKFALNFFQVKVQMDDLTKFANDRMTALANLEAWEQPSNPASDDLALDEKLVHATESALDDDVEESGDDTEEGEHGDGSQDHDFDLTDELMSVAAE